MIGSSSLLAVAATLGCSPELAGPAAAQTAPPASQGKSNDAGGVIARVGDRAISVSDLDASLAGRRGGRRAGTPRPAQYRAALERRIELVLIDVEAKERGILIDADYVAQRDAILAEAEERLYRLQRRLLLEQLASEAKVGEDELKARMQQTPRRFQTRRIHLRRLIVDDEAAATAAAARIAASESFAEVSAEVSTDAALREARGDLGLRDVSTLPPRLASRARALQTQGAVSEPFRAEGKWNLIQLVAEPQDVARPFDEISPQLEQEVRAAKAEQALPQLLSERRAEVGVSIDEERLATLGATEAPALPKATKPAR